MGVVAHVISVQIDGHNIYKNTYEEQANFMDVIKMEGVMEHRPHQCLKIC